MDDKATIIAGTEIKGTYVKIAADAAMPYTIKRVVTDYSSAALDAAYDGSLPAWLTISSSTKNAGSGLYRHEIVYTVTAHPAKTSQLQTRICWSSGLSIRIRALRCLVCQEGRNFIHRYIVVSLRILCITLWIRRISVEMKDLRLILL